jgi:predicted amidophosphoribosyltransferase
MISRLKTAEGANRRPHYADVLGRVAAGYIASHVGDFGGYELIVPAPTHPDSVAERGGLDITARIQQICATVAGPLMPNAAAFQDPSVPVWDQITRVGARGKSWKERAEAVKGAYIVRDTADAVIDSKRTLVIDDVYTTGLDLEEMASELIAHGATSVDALVVVRHLYSGKEVHDSSV